jgi:predicted transposase YbfD/YdcC
MLEALITELEAIEDPRCGWKVEHRLIDVLVIAVCAVLGEAESFEDIALYGRCKRAWLEGFLELPNGIPSHDTFRRVLMLVDPEAFERCFLGWVRAVFRSDEDAPRQIAIDGKTVRGSFDRKHGRSPLHLVSAYATEHGLVLAQRAAEEKKGELTVLPELLDGLDLRGCLVSLDALACRPEIAQRIVGRGGDYLVTLKGNQRRSTRRCGPGSRPTPSRWAARSAPSSTPLTTATAGWSGGGCSPARTSACSARSRTGRT